VNDDFKRRWNLRQVESGVLEGDALGEIIRRGALAVQADAEILADGLCGPDTVSQLDLDRDPPQSDVPIPRGRRADIERVYGTFDYEESEDTKGAIIIERGWSRRNIVKVDFFNGLYTYAHKLVAREMAELFEAACLKSGYTPEKIWSWVPRHKRHDPKAGLSTHAWGISFDVDSAKHRPHTTDGPLFRYPAWAKTFTDANWTWGQHWTRYPDPMHFQRTK